MKFAIVAFAILAVVAADKLTGQEYAQVLRNDAAVNPDGSYQYNYETSNGISANEQGALKQVGKEVAESVQGGFAYTAPDGTPIQVQYVADENGFQPTGAHLPVAPAIPEAIVRALKFIASQPPARH